MERRTTQTVAKKIVDFFRSSRRLPTYEEMLSLLEVRSKSVVHFWVEKLVREGTLKRDARGRLSLAPRLLGVPIAGDVRAGFPSPAEEELCDILSLDEYLISRPEASFILRVTGDSMIGEGIREGDLVIVERGRVPMNGDIVIAEVDGEWTMKFFRKRGEKVFLEAANSRYPTIEARQELRIGGVVTAVIRKYDRGSHGRGRR
ncbi:MAG: transcriptional repressor LexA [Syntrophales bacterium]|nr:transcriptional repressor LexA [Syntrophales bacterium]